MRLFTTASVCLGIALTAIAAGIPSNSLTATIVADAPTGVAVTPTVQEPDLIEPNMAPIVSGDPLPNIPPPGACGQSVQMSMIGSMWLMPNACHPFTEAGDIPAHVVEFLNRGYTNCKSCAFWFGSKCEGDVAWAGKIPPGSFQLTFPFRHQPYSYECLDFDSNWP
ncbi:hypothetical protein P171DRAFT_482017 [Karstenula rhodostoma CBS 690.94]|uniref:Uncharacterized protein n=1 Tax=Karstenula rhodostoma CBS 690.94 TaxID=1392251 RepID=A0A9P4PTB6_9PLEO|nr:hypothetical protein P171DRAFT_482017 [Karstenula rhodostoma CBS 690.94]